MVVLCANISLVSFDQGYGRVICSDTIYQMSSAF